MSTVRIAAAQTPEFWQDQDGALGHLVAASSEAQVRGASLLCFPEGFLQGYLTEPDAARRYAVDLNSPAFGAVLAQLPPNGPTLVFGLIEIEGDRVFNTAVVVKRQTLVGRYRKANLLRREQGLHPGSEAGVFEVDGLRFGVNICHDTNFPAAAQAVASLGASLIVCPANNMLPRAAAETWKDAHNEVRADRCRETGMWLISADVTGERDGAVAWGPTAVLNPAGEVVAQLPLGAPGLLVFDVPATAG